MFCFLDFSEVERYILKSFNLRTIRKDKTLYSFSVSNNLRPPNEVTRKNLQLFPRPEKFFPTGTHFQFYPIVFVSRLVFFKSFSKK